MATARERLLESSRHFLPVLILLAVLFFGFALTQDAFMTEQNLKNLLTGVGILWLVSMAMTFVLISGGLDLSVPAVIAMTSVLLGKLLHTGMPEWLAILLAVLFGGVLGGLLNGVSIGVLRLSFFVVTLASLTALSGVVSLWSNAQTEFVNGAIIKKIGVGEFAGVPTLVWIMVAALLVFYFVQRRTYFGRDVYAVGGSLDAARLSGIPTARVLVAVYALSGLCAGLAGVVQVGRIGAASPQISAEIALQAVAAVLIGGTLLTGGFGGVGGTAIGVLFVGVLQNGLGIAGVSAYWQQVVTGVILFLAVLLTQLRSNAYELPWRRFRRPRSSTETDATPEVTQGAT